MVEEFLRFESPFQSAPRTVTEDVALHGQTLRRGDLVYAMFGAANRDPRQFAHADQLDFHRPDNRQIAFGHGIHLCLGAAGSRLETPIALRHLLESFGVPCQHGIQGRWPARNQPKPTACGCACNGKVPPPSHPASASAHGCRAFAGMTTFQIAAGEYCLWVAWVPAPAAPQTAPARPPALRKVW